MATTQALSVEWETEKFRRFTEEMIDEMEGEQATLALKKTAFDLLKRVIEKTPVDTGRARGGWLAYLEEENVQVNVSEGSSRSLDPQAVAEGREMGDFEEELRGPFKRIEMLNGVEYIIPLEYGHSDQAPAGMLRIAMREMRTGSELTEEMRKRMVAAMIQANRTAARKSNMPGSPGRLPG